jgi:hypothetical protein
MPTHSQNLENNADEIKGIIADMKDKSKKEIETKIAEQMEVSQRTAERHYKRFKPIEHPTFELGEYKKESACKVLRGVNNAIDDIEGNVEDIKDKLELFHKAAITISTIKTF